MSSLLTRCQCRLLFGVLTLWSLAVASAAGAAAGLPAFPGAEGSGATTPGGRGGRVWLVTNLHDSGPGSLREACEAPGKRTVVFRVAGTIALRRPLVIREPFLTLAGQSAPGDGICLRDHPLQIATHDVVVRYLRCRLGDESRQEADALDVVHGARRVVLDHCSATWSVDECLSLSGDVSEVTVQWCLIGQSLNQSAHRKGAHGYGSLARANGPVTFHHNLWLHNNSRNPRLGDNYGRGGAPSFDVRNNVIYDFGGTCTGLTQGKFTVNYVANYVRPGPSSKAKTPITIGGPSELVFYLRDNVLEGDAALTADNTRWLEPVLIDGVRQVRWVDTPFPAAPVQTQPAAEAYARVLAEVGANRPVRDAEDARLIANVRQRTGRLINSQAEVGGWPRLRAGEAPIDTDGDGLPDAWESARGLNPRDARDGAADRDGDGYTNLEEYLQELARPTA